VPWYYSSAGALVPRIASFGPSAPWFYSSAGVIVPRIASLGQQQFGFIRVRALLSLESLLQASGALVLFECGRDASGGDIFSPSSWEPQQEGMMNIAARFSLSKKPRFIDLKGKKPND
jgi:hypothetical protein